MSLINLSDREKQAIRAIDGGVLHDLVDQAITSEHLGGLSKLPLYDCGDYVATKLRHLDSALAAYRIAKSVKKREETLYSAHKAGGDLTVRRQGFWDNMRFELAEALAHQGCHFMLPLLDEASGAV